MTGLDLYKLFQIAASKGWEVDEKKFPDIDDAKFYPNPEDIFKALELIRPEDVNYLILGQDPYYSESDSGPDAIGIAFGINPETREKPRSLIRIMSYVYGGREGKADLTDWVEQKGILLLNAALTVPGNNDRKSAGKHLKEGLWDCFTKQIIKQLRSKNPEVEMIAWGCAAKKKLTEALNRDDTQLTWCYHPVASKAGGNSFSAFWRTDIGRKLVMQPKDNHG